MPEPLDDVTIADGERLLHRIRPDDVHIDADGQCRPSSAAFRYINNVTSVDIASLTTPETTLEGYPAYRLVEINAGTVRSLGCRIVRDPQPDNLAHALIYGNAPDGRLTKSQAKQVANRCRWVTVDPR